jgi:hypothetical protein
MVGGRARWRVRSTLGDVDIELHPSASDAAGRAASVRELARLVFAFKFHDREARGVLLQVHARLRARDTSRGVALDSAVAPAQAEVIGADLLNAARAGQLVARRRVARQVVVAVLDDDEKVLGPESEPTAWIAIELVDDQGNAVPGVDYRIECNDGRVRTGTTNASGKAREDGLHAGNCKVSFPRLHGPDWKKAG